VQRAIEAGDSLSGVTVFQLDEGMDTSPIFSTKRFALDTDITSDELLIELAELGVEAVMDSLQAITDGKRPTTQSGEGATKASKITKQECEIDWNLSAQVISQKVRAFTSNPGAWTRFRGDTLKIDSVSLEDSSLKPGTLHIVDKKLIVGTGSNALAIGFLTPSGKSRMEALSWINGARITDGEYFG
jgi:methionyl-tRNA formyltransferase